MSLFDSMNKGGASAGSEANALADATTRFSNHVQVKAFDDNFVDRDEERALLETAADMGLSIDEAVKLIRQVAEDKGYAVERALDEQATQRLADAANDKKGVEKKEFDEAVRLYLADAKGAVSEKNVKRKLKQVVLDHGWKVKEGGLFGATWFSDIS